MKNVKSLIWNVTKIHSRSNSAFHLATCPSVYIHLYAPNNAGKKRQDGEQGYYKAGCLSLFSDEAPQANQPEAATDVITSGPCSIPTAFIKFKNQIN